MQPIPKRKSKRREPPSVVRRGYCALENGKGLLAGHAGKPFQELLHGRAAFEVLEQRPRSSAVSGTILQDWMFGSDTRNSGVGARFRDDSCDVFFNVRDSMAVRGGEL